ncbi:hypothetical protein J2W21_003605 [Sinomonas atrocyanea]|uniref:hypothetical protein n=1 Tax=Sinomonas atrocyanea TaxID=37927 RepID=UPI002786344C|nr:hypothetical protein [Sinomonas atrocyanea]MDP9886080.1 hypothetical protein [Sinomonas atrocyanea]
MTEETTGHAQSDLGALSDQELRGAEALRRIVADGIEAILRPAGFEPCAKLAWIRGAGELQHVVALLVRRGMYDVQWGVVSPEAVPFLWGRPAQRGDVGDAVLSGTPGTVHHPPAAQSFRLEPTVRLGAVSKISAGLSVDMGRVEQRLSGFSSRRELRTYLMANRDAKDRRDFVIPANLPLKLFVATALAIIDGDQMACGLLAETEHAMAPYKDEISTGRLERLRKGTQGLCP